MAVGTTTSVLGSGTAPQPRLLVRGVDGHGLGAELDCGLRLAGGEEVRGVARDGGGWASAGGDLVQLDFARREVVQAVDPLAVRDVLFG